MSRTFVASSFVVLCAGAVLGAPPGPQTSRQRPIAVVLDDAGAASRRSAAAGIVALGGRVLHAFDDLLVVEIPAGTELRVSQLPGIQELALGGITTSPRRGRRGPAFGQAAWNVLARGLRPVDRGEGVPTPMEDDALTPPEVSLEAVRAASRSVAGLSGGGRGALSAGAATTYSAPFGATALNTSEFLAGGVSVNIVLVESDGSIDASTENWSSARENEVVSGIAAGLEWIRLQEPQAALHFVYHVISGRTDARARTGYEPIRRAADPSGTTGEDLWAKAVLGKLGYVSGDRFVRSRALASDTRIADGTDWAVNVFVVDSLADTDGKFADGRFAYCWIGGPHLVMTYDNQAWGIDRMDMVLRHELLHAFYAFDEYATSACDCTSHRGYLDGVNANCAACNPQASPCVMISNGDAMCSATRRHLGWADLDGDGAIDVIGQDPDTFLDALPGNVCAAPALSGLASVVAATNRNTYPGTTHPSISVNRISGVEYRVDGSPWTSAQAAAGNWGSPQGLFSASLPALGSGSHHFEVRAVDDFGNRDAAPVSVDIVAHVAVAALGDSVRAQRFASGVGMSWDACSGAAGYRVYRKASPTAAPSLVAETPSTSWSDPAATIGYYQVRPVDACGTERSD
jgi:hypothetical protein